MELNPHALEQHTASGWIKSAPRSAHANANVQRRLSATSRRPWQIGTNDQLFKAKEYEPLIVAYRNGNAVRLPDIAERDGFGRGMPQRRAVRTASPPS